MTLPALVVQPRPFLDGRRFSGREFGAELDSPPKISARALVLLVVAGFTLVAAGLVAVGWPASRIDPPPTLAVRTAPLSSPAPMTPGAPAVDASDGVARFDGPVRDGPFLEPGPSRAAPALGTTIVAEPPAFIDSPSPTAADRVAAPAGGVDSEVGLIPAAIAWLDEDGVAYQGLIGIDDIPAEVLGLPEGVSLGE